MTRTQFLTLATAAFAKAETRPNIVIIAGDPKLAPSLNQPITFDRAYTAAPSPGPAKASILTGRFPHSHKVFKDEAKLASDEITLASLCRQAGYRVAFAGDWPVADESTTLSYQGPFCHFIAPPEPFQNAGIAGNTIVVITTPHGTAIDQHTEAALRVQLHIQLPDTVRATFRTTGLVSNIDIMPTLLKLCGIAIPEGIHGRDLTATQPESIYAQGNFGSESEWRVAIRGFDKLITNYNAEPVALFNLSQDPNEQESLLGQRTAERTRDAMLALLLDWQKRTGDGRSASGLRKRK